MIRPHLYPLPMEEESRRQNYSISSPLRQREEAGFAAGEGSACLFSSLDVYHDVDSRSAALNMAIDEALLETVTVTTIRFYQWNHPALSFGYFGKFDDVSNYQRDTVRRWTGGGIVIHAEDLTYSIVIPANDPAFAESSMSIYEKVHCGLRATLVANGLPCELAEDSPLSARRSPFKAHCFANPVRADVLSNGRKIAGAAQRRTRRGLLQQGSIQNANLGNGFADSFARALCNACRQGKLNPTLLARAEEIARQKYGTAAWLRRR